MKAVPLAGISDPLAGIFDYSSRPLAGISDWSIWRGVKSSGSIMWNVEPGSADSSLPPGGDL